MCTHLGVLTITAIPKLSLFMHLGRYLAPFTPNICLFYNIYLHSCSAEPEDNCLHHVSKPQNAPYIIAPPLHHSVSFGVSCHFCLISQEPPRWRTSIGEAFMAFSLLIRASSLSHSKICLKWIFSTITSSSRELILICCLALQDITSSYQPSCSTWYLL